MAEEMGQAWQQAQVDANLQRVYAASGRTPLPERLDQLLDKLRHKYPREPDP